MRLIAILVLAFGAALAAGAIYFAQDYFEKYQQAQANQGPKLISVIAAQKTIAYGDKLGADGQLRWVQIPEETAPEGVFTEISDLLGPKGERGRGEYIRYALREFVANEPILASRVTGFGEQQRMAMRLAEGRRAFTIRIDAVSGVGGFVNPGDRVDILMTRGGSDTLESVVILRNILVIAVDQKTNARSNASGVGRTATVEVTPTEAQKLALAQQVGQLSLTLRGYGEEAPIGEPERPETVDLNDLLGERAPEVRPSIKVRKGTESAEEVTLE